MRSALVRLATVARRRSFSPFNFQKRTLLDATFETVKPTPRSFADLGGVWNVNGAYTFDLLDRYTIDRAILVDTDFTDIVELAAKSHPQLSLLHESFGDPTVPQQIGEVDVIMLFDVLLHQVAPDWDEILERYAPVTQSFAIYNQQWTGEGSKVRLLDLGEEGYFRNVPHNTHPTYEGLFDRLDELHPQHNRPWRDVHNIWQWGITDDDLRGKLKALGFEETYYRNHGPFGILPNIENHAFVFVKR